VVPCSRAFGSSFAMLAPPRDALWQRPLPRLCPTPLLFAGALPPCTDDVTFATEPANGSVLTRAVRPDSTGGRFLASSQRKRRLGTCSLFMFFHVHNTCLF